MAERSAGEGGDARISMDRFLGGVAMVASSAGWIYGEVWACEAQVAAMLSVPHNPTLEQW